MCVVKAALCCPASVNAILAAHDDDGACSAATALVRDLEREWCLYRNLAIPSLPEAVSPSWLCADASFESMVLVLYKFSRPGRGAPSPAAHSTGARIRSQISTSSPSPPSSNKFNSQDIAIHFKNKREKI